MRLLVGIAEMGTGGAETIVEELAIDRVARGDEVTIASAGGFRADRLRERDVRTLHVPLTGRSRLDLLRSVRIVRQDVRAHRPDLVHVHNVKAAAVVRAATVPRRRPTLVTLHGVPDAAYASAARVLRRVAHRLVAVSQDVADRVVAEGFPLERTTVIENAVTAPPAHDRAAARARLDLAPDARVAVCVARLVDQKRHDLLVSAWRAVPADAVLLIAGDGPNRDRIAEQVTAAGLEHRVRLLGARTDVDWLLAAADLSVLPSDWEGLPISILEALAAGVPVVASAVGGLVEALPGAAELVVPGSAEAFAAGVTTVLEDAHWRASLRSAGRSLVEGRFGIERMRAAYDAEYRRLLG